MSTALERRADDNIVSMWQTVGAAIGGTFVESASFPLAATGVPVAALNGGLVREPLDDPAARLAEVSDLMADLGMPFIVWVRAGLDDATVEAALAAGFTEVAQPPAMVLERIGALPDAPAGVQVSRVENQRPRRHVLRCLLGRLRNPQRRRQTTRDGGDDHRRDARRCVAVRRRRTRGVCAGIDHR